MSGDLSKGTVITQIRELVTKLKMENNTEFHVVLYTSMGQIVCDIEPPASENSLLGYTDDPTEFTVDISAFFDGKYEFESQLINAKNVTINSRSGEELSRMGQMILFTDQILGFTITRKQI
jgi:hypothetical protein